jgi:hypothetical protein
MSLDSPSGRDVSPCAVAGSWDTHWCLLGIRPTDLPSHWLPINESLTRMVAGSGPSLNPAVHGDLSSWS